jgi:8-oxo-dGTP diphosphatase
MLNTIVDDEKILFQSKWVSLKETQKGFQYLERKGINSVAVFLLRRIPKSESIPFEVLIRFQPLPVDNSFDQQLFPCPITGSIDDGEKVEESAIREAYEEAGYIIKNDMHYLGRYFVGTQTNEKVFMFYADVTDLKLSKPKNDGTYHESISKNEWKKFEFLKTCEYSACQLGFYLLKEKIIF